MKDIQGMLKQAQALQAKMTALQEELRTRELWAPPAAAP